jgi:hypothetical protein
MCLSSPTLCSDTTRFSAFPHGKTKFDTPTHHTGARATTPLKHSRKTRDRYPCPPPKIKPRETMTRIQLQRADKSKDEMLFPVHLLRIEVNTQNYDFFAVWCKKPTWMQDALLSRNAFTVTQAPCALWNSSPGTYPATWNTVMGKQVHVNNQANRLSSFDLCFMKEVAWRLAGMTIGRVASPEDLNRIANENKAITKECFFELWQPKFNLGCI